MIMNFEPIPAETSTPNLSKNIQTMQNKNKKNIDKTKKILNTLINHINYKN